MSLTKQQKREIEFDRLNSVLESCQHYLNGVRNNHLPSYNLLLESLRDIQVSITIMTVSTPTEKDL
jgi:hypothetical protein